MWLTVVGKTPCEWLGTSLVIPWKLVDYCAVKRRINRDSGWPLGNQSRVMHLFWRALSCAGTLGGHEWSAHTPVNGITSGDAVCPAWEGPGALDTWEPIMMLLDVAALWQALICPRDLPESLQQSQQNVTLDYIGSTSTEVEFRFWSSVFRNELLFQEELSLLCLI